MRKLNRGDRRIAIVAIIVIAVVTILVAIVGPRGQKNAVASGNKEVETTTEALTTQQPEPETEPVDYSSNIVYDDGNNFVSIHGYGDIREGGVNIRTEPSLNSESVAKINIGTELMVKRYYNVSGWYGFDVEDIGFGNKTDTDGIVWISTFYCSVSHYNVPEQNDDLNYEKIVRYNTPVSVVVKSNVNVNSRPTAGTDYSYGIISAGASFDASIVYRSKTWIFFGFKVEEIEKSGFKATYGDLEADPDGIVWVAEEYLSLYAQ